MGDQTEIDDRIAYATLVLSNKEKTGKMDVFADNNKESKYNHETEEIKESPLEKNDIDILDTKADVFAESEEAEEDKKMSPGENPQWITGTKGDFSHDTEFSSELEHIHEETETNDDANDFLPLYTIVKAAKKIGRAHV